MFADLLCVPVAQGVNIGDEITNNLRDWILGVVLSATFLKYGAGFLLFVWVMSDLTKAKQGRPLSVLGRGFLFLVDGLMWKLFGRKRVQPTARYKGKSPKGHR